MAFVMKPTPGAMPGAVALKKKKDDVPTGNSLDEILAGIRKDKGDKVIVMGNKVPLVRRLPTGIFELDFYIGGGFPCGRFSIVYGPESSNKTNLCLKAAAAAQKLKGRNRVIWVNIEQSFDPIWAEAMGVDTSKLLVVNAGYGEEAIDIIDAVIRADDVALVVVDSIAALISSKEVNQSVENYDIATSALLIKRMSNKLAIAFGECQKRDHDPCVILINQTRFKPGVVYGDPETMPGGEAVKFLSALRIRVRATNIIDKARNTLMFKDTTVVIKKAKVPVRAVSFDFKLCVHAHDDLQIGDTDSFNMVKSHLQALSLLEKHPKGWKVDGKVHPTLGAVSDRYYRDKEYQAVLQAMVLEQYQGKMMVVSEPDPSVADVEPGVAEVVQPIA